MQKNNLIIKYYVCFSRLKPPGCWRDPIIPLPIEASRCDKLIKVKLNKDSRLL